MYSDTFWRIATFTALAWGFFTLGLLAKAFLELEEAAFEQRYLDNENRELLDRLANRERSPARGD